MKYRIKQIGDLFYPQGRLFGLFWFDYAGQRKQRISFDSLSGARKFLDDVINKEAAKKNIKIHPYQYEPIHLPRIQEQRTPSLSI